MSQLHDAEYTAAWRWRQMEYLLQHGAGEHVLQIKQKRLTEAMVALEVARIGARNVRGTDSRPSVV